MGKWTPTHEGPLVVMKLFSGSAMMLTAMDGEDFPHPVNADIVKKNTTHKRPVRLTHLSQIRASRQTKRFGKTLGIYATDCTPDTLTTRKGDLG